MSKHSGCSGALKRCHNCAAAQMSSGYAAAVRRFVVSLRASSGSCSMIKDRERGIACCVGASSTGSSKITLSNSSLTRRLHSSLQRAHRSHRGGSAVPLMWQRLHGPASPQPSGLLTGQNCPSARATDPRRLQPSPLPRIHHSTSRDRRPNKACRSKRAVGCVSRRTVVLSAPAGAAAMSAPVADDVTTEAPAVRAKPPKGDGDLSKMRAYWCAAARESQPLKAS